MPHTVMIVEHEETFRFAAERHLRAAGYDVMSVADTIAALDAFDNGAEVDLIVTDIVMPKGKPHGLALARMARLHRQIPFIFITAYKDLAIDEAALPGRLFHKPVDLAELVEEIKQRLSATRD